MEFQLDSICSQVSDNAIEEALESVPEDMDAAYARILNMINKKPRGQRELARKVLICTAYSRSPLPISILAYIVSVKNDTKSLEALESSIPTETSILSACSNLVSVDRRTREVRFVHFSVQEFLISDRSSSTLRIGHDLAHRELAWMFITLLSILNHQSLEAFKEGSLLLSTLDNWPFYVLAANLNFLSEDDPLLELISAFLEQSPPMFVETHHSYYTTLHTYLGFSPSVLALIFNLPSGHQRYQTRLPNGKIFSCNQLRDLYMSSQIILHDHFAVHYTTRVLDSVPATYRLYAHGYYIDYFYSTDSTVRIWGFEIDHCLQDYEIPIMYDHTPLYSAQSEKIAKFLLDNGASIEPRHIGNELVDPLRFFARKGNSKIIQLLLDKIIDLYGVQIGAVLGNAICSDHYGIEGKPRLLADIGNALHTAAYSGDLGTVRLLLDWGADVNAQGGEYGNALQAAVTGDNVLEVVQLLLARGVDVNAQGGEYGNALQAAVCRVSGDNALEVVQLLLERGAKVNAQGGEYGNALHAAVRRVTRDKVLEVVQLLLDMGADVNAQGGKYGNALQATLCKFRGDKVLEVVQLLLDRGANVNAQGGKYGNALQAALCKFWGDKVLEVVQLLLDRGADVNAQGGKYGNVLQAAICGFFGNKVLEVVQLLLDRGADVNAQGGKYGNALQAAICKFFGDKVLEVVQFLLDRGADVNAKGGLYGTALQAAACEAIEVEGFEYFLEMGADVNAQGGIHGTALKAAHSDRIRELLLNHGATY